MEETALSRTENNINDEVMEDTDGDFKMSGFKFLINITF